MSALVAKTGISQFATVADLGFDFGWGPLAQIPGRRCSAFGSIWLWRGTVWPPPSRHCLADGGGTF